MHPLGSRLGQSAVYRDLVPMWDSKKLFASEPVSVVFLFVLHQPAALVVNGAGKGKTVSV